MGLRIRSVDGATVALDAGKSCPEPGDLYLDDLQTAALRVRFDLEFSGAGLMRSRFDGDPADYRVAIIRRLEGGLA